MECSNISAVPTFQSSFISDIFSYSSLLKVACPQQPPVVVLVCPEALPSSLLRGNPCLSMTAL
jgi:hypothetical protein